MFHGRNNGKKLMAVRIVRHTFEIIHLLTGEVIDQKKRRIFFQIYFK
jgi:ribosomal protein S7